MFIGGFCWSSSSISEAKSFKLLFFNFSSFLFIYMCTIHIMNTQKRIEIKIKKKSFIIHTHTKAIIDPQLNLRKRSDDNKISFHKSTRCHLSPHRNIFFPLLIPLRYMIRWKIWANAEAVCTVRKSVYAHKK